MLELDEQTKELCRNAYSKEKIETLQKSAEEGDAEAQYQLGLYYAFDDDAKSVEYYIKAAEQGHAAAQCNLATCYSGGRGVAQNYQKALQLYSMSAEQGYANAQFYLGYFYILMKDNTKGIEWLKKAAAQGQEQAIQVLEQTQNQ